MTDQEFCLRWNNHESSLSAVLELMLKKGALVDVTFACGGELLQAHRTVLSACSPYFESMFVETAHPHPIVILRDVKAEEFRSVIDFMYRGEVTVCQSQLPSFLRTAESLQVRGLTEKYKSTTDTNAVIQTDAVPDLQASPPGSPLSGKDSNYRKKRRKRLGPEFPDSSPNNTFQTPIPCTSNSTITSQNSQSYPVLPSTSFSLVETSCLESLLPLQETKNLASTISLIDSLSQYSYLSEPSHDMNVKQEASLVSAVPTLLDMVSNDNALNFGASTSAASYPEKALQVGSSRVSVYMSDNSGSTGQERLELNRESEAPGNVTLENQIGAGPRSGVCTVCGHFRSDLRQHMESHLGSVFQCLICGRSYPRRKTLNQHIKRTHSKEVKDPSSNHP